jgi:uncharacterized protein involved in exopolysaccharide biosynthesis
MRDTFFKLYSLEDLKRLLWRRRRLMAVVFAAVFVPAALVTLLMPPTYMATARLLLDRDRRVPDYAIRSNAADGSALFRQVNQKEELTTEVERLRSRSVLAPVVTSLSLSPEKLTFVRDVRLYVRRTYDWITGTARTIYNETRYALHISTRPSPEDLAMFRSYALLDDVAGRVSVEVVPDSNIIEVSFRSSDALLARDVCNAIVAEYLAQRSQKTPAGAEQFFLAQSRKMADDLRAHEGSVDVLERQLSVYSVDEQRKLILGSMAATDDRLKDTRTNIARLSRKAALLPEQLASEPETITTSTDVNRNPAFDLVNQRLVELELSRVKLLEQYQPTSQVIQGIDEQIKVARQIQSSVPKTLDGSATRAINPVRQNLRAELLGVESELAALQAQERALDRSLAAYRADLDRLGQNALKINDSRRQIAAEEQAYSIYLKNQEQARVTDAMESSDLNDLRVVDQAPLPLHAIAPRPRIYLGVAFAASLLMAFGMALLADQNDRSIGTPEQLQEAFGLPLLASFPVVRAKELDA